MLRMIKILFMEIIFPAWAFIALLVFIAAPWIALIYWLFIR